MLSLHRVSNLSLRKLLLSDQQKTHKRTQIFFLNGHILFKIRFMLPLGFLRSAPLSQSPAYFVLVIHFYLVATPYLINLCSNCRDLCLLGYDGENVGV